MPAVSIGARLPAFDERGHHSRPPQPWADTELVAAEVRAHVRACIDRLPEPYRAIILVRDIEGLDTPATADLFGISVALVKTRLHRARQALRTLLEPYFDTADGMMAV